MDKESRWLRARRGKITASELGDMFSASGKVTDGIIDYLRHKRFERRRGFTYPVNAKNFDIGHYGEPYAVEWFRACHPQVDLIYSQELPEIPIWEADFANFSASPDAFSRDESFGLEIKTLVGNTATEFYADEKTSYEDKRASVMKEHGYQIAGQFLSNPKLDRICLLKYIYQRDEVDEDTDSPLAAWRGIEFIFFREDFDLDAIKKRIILFDKFIDSGYESKAFKKLNLDVVDGQLVEV